MVEMVLIMVMEGVVAQIYLLVVMNEHILHLVVVVAAAAAPEVAVTCKVLLETFLVPELLTRKVAMAATVEIKVLVVKIMQTMEKMAVAAAAEE